MHKVPGFHRLLKRWAERTPQYCSDGLVPFPTDDPVMQRGQPIPVRAGSVVIWNSELAHCNYPVNSNRFRFTQYLKVFPAAVIEDDVELYRIRSEALQRMLPTSSGFTVSSLGRKLFGLDPWPDS